MDREGIASLRSADEQTRSYQLISVVKQSVHSVEGLFWQNSAQMLYFCPSILLFEIVSHYYPGWPWNHGDSCLCHPSPPNSTCLDCKVELPHLAWPTSSPGQDFTFSKTSDALMQIQLLLYLFYIHDLSKLGLLRVERAGGTYGSQKKMKQNKGGTRY